jgi:hypothetical protein
MSMTPGNRGAVVYPSHEETRMRSKRILSSLAVRKAAVHGLTLALAVSVAMPEQLPAATIPASPAPGLKLAFVPDSLPSDLLLVHCCHAHPLYPYDSYCCHSGGAVVVAPGAYYGAAGVRGTARRTARRTTRRVSRR